MIQNFLTEIESHFAEEYPKEGCGLLGIKKGKAEWLPCKNIAEVNENFIMDSSEYIKYKRTHDIVGVVHSHPDESPEPSIPDINQCNALGIPYYIFSYPDMQMAIVKPKKDLTELYGREYEFGVTDCFEAVRDYYLSKDMYVPNRILWEKEWYNKDTGLDYFCPEIVKQWGGEEIDINDLKENDLLTFKIDSEVANHCGVFLGNDVFYHHATNRLSCRENLYPFWISYIDKAYRYVA